MTLSFLYIYWQQFKKILVSLFSVNLVMTWMIMTTSGVDGALRSPMLLALFSLEVFFVGIFLRFSKAQRYLYQTLQQKHRTLEAILALLLVTFVLVFVAVPIFSLVSVVSWLQYDVNAVDIFSAAYLVLFLPLTYFASALVSDWRHWTTGLVGLGLMPFLGSIWESELSTQVIFLLVAYLVASLYFIFELKYRRVIIAGIASIGFYWCLIAVFGAFALPFGLGSVSEDQREYIELSPVPLPQQKLFLETAGNDVRLDWINHKVYAPSNSDLWKPNRSVLHRGIRGQEKQLSLVAFREIEKTWKEDYASQLPLTLRLDTETMVFLFDRAMYRVSLKSEATDKAWQAKDDQKITEVFHFSAFRTGNRGIMWMVGNQLHWVVSVENFWMDHHQVYLPFNADRLAITNEVGDLAEIHVFPEKGDGIAIGLTSGYIESRRIKNIKSNESSFIDLATTISPIHTFMLSWVTGSSLQSTLTQAWLPFMFVSVFLTAIYFKGSRFLWIKLFSVFLLGAPLLLSLIAYFPKSSGRQGV